MFFSLKKNCLIFVKTEKRYKLKILKISFCSYTDSFIEKCPFCYKSHRAQDEETGYILNEFIVNHFELKPEKVYRCPSYEKLDKLLEILNNDLKELNSKLEYPKEKIK